MSPRVGGGEAKARSPAAGSCGELGRMVLDSLRQIAWGGSINTDSWAAPSESNWLDLVCGPGVLHFNECTQ